MSLFCLVRDETKATNLSNESSKTKKINLLALDGEMFGAKSRKQNFSISLVFQSQKKTADEAFIVLA